MTLLSSPDMILAEIVIVFKGIYDWLEQFGTEQTNSKYYQISSSPSLWTVLTGIFSQRNVWPELRRL